MGKYKRYKNSIEKFLSSDKGQRFFNFAYSIGAAIVIWGALFKILHLPGGSLLLSIGMGTEVLMFILSAFDTPPKTYHWEEVFPVLNSPKTGPNFQEGKEPSLSVETAKAEVVTEGTIPISPRPMPKELWEYPKASI